MPTGRSPHALRVGLQVGLRFGLHFGWALVLATSVVAAGCSSTPKGTNATGKGLSKTDEQIFLGDTIEKNYDPHVILKRAESFFDREEFPEAVVEFQHFLELHRAHALAPYAQFRLGQAYFQQARGIDRDPDPINKAMAVFEKLRVEYPGSQYDEQALDGIKQGQESLAKTHLFVGKFYQRRGAYLAAAHRFEVVVNEYAEMEAAPEALYQLAKTYDTLGADEWARERLTVLAQRYPSSPFQEDGKKLWAKLGGATASEPVVAGSSPSRETSGSSTLIAAAPAPHSSPELQEPSRMAGAKFPTGSAALSATPTFCRLGVWC